MFKEVHKSSKDVDFTRKGTPPCAVCKNLSKTPLYVCESSSIICENCQKDVEKRQDRGDSSLTTNKRHSSIKCNLDIRRINSESACAHAQDFASGDHDIHIKASKSKRKSKSDHKIRTVCENYDLLGIGKYKDIRKKHELKQDIETVIRYQNAHFNKIDSNTSSLTTFENTSDLIIKADENYLPNYITFPRPVICPVSDCGKIIAIESIMYHFCFDHSKVPRIMLDRSIAHQVLLKAFNITMKTQCLTVYLLPNNPGPVHRPDDSNTILNRSNNNQNTLLLIGVRLKIDRIHRTKMSSSCYTQTGMDFQDLQGNRKETQLFVDMNRKKLSCDTKGRFENNEILLLWICKLNNSPSIYSITISSEDKKKGHSFIGEAIHIKDQQDPITMYQRSECLIAHGNAANRLLDDQSQFIVLVNVLE